jgi:hypothetical protein
MIPAPSIFDEPDDAADERAALQAEADADAGRVVPDDEVAAWLDSWGRPDVKPAPRKWFKSSERPRSCATWMRSPPTSSISSLWRLGDWPPD